MGKDDLILAFFPCTRFEAQILLSFRGEQSQDKGMSDIDKLQRDLKLQEELTRNYELITKLAIIVLRRGLKMVFENPYSTQHYLTRYWSMKPAIIDQNRQDRGDYFVKPTQYWFFNCKPEQNLIMEAEQWNGIGSLWSNRNKRDYSATGAKSMTTARSMIHPAYANRFIREFILDQEEFDGWKR